MILLLSSLGTLDKGILFFSAKIYCMTNTRRMAFWGTSFPVGRSELERAAELCALAERTNSQRDPACCCNPRDKLNQGLAQLGLQLLEPLEFIPFPLKLCSGFIAQDARTATLYVALSGSFKWSQYPMPQFWDRVVSWNGHGRVAEVFDASAKALLDTLKMCMRKIPKSDTFRYSSGQSRPLDRKVQICGYGLAAPIAYLLNLEIKEFACNLAYEVKAPVLFGCPKFVDSTFAQWAATQMSVMSLALDSDWLARMPITPLNWQFQWTSTPLAIDLGFKPLFEDPTQPGQTKQAPPEEYLDNLKAII